jgi:hypothetical protein
MVVGEAQMDAAEECGGCDAFYRQENGGRVMRTGNG